MHGNYRHHYLLSPAASQQQSLATTIPSTETQATKPARHQPQQPQQQQQQQQQQQAASPTMANSNFNGLRNSPTNVRIQHSQILAGNYSAKRQQLQPGSDLQELDKQASITLQRPYNTTRYLHQQQQVAGAGEKIEQYCATNTARQQQQQVARMATSREYCNATDSSQQSLEVPDLRHQRSTISIARQQQQQQNNNNINIGNNYQNSPLNSKTQVNNNYSEVSPKYVDDSALLVNDAHLYQEQYASQLRNNSHLQHRFHHQPTSNHQQTTTNQQFLNHQQQVQQQNHHMQQQQHIQNFSHTNDKSSPARSPTATTSGQQTYLLSTSSHRQHAKSTSSASSTANKTDDTTTRSQVHVNFNRPANGSGQDAEDGDSRKKKYLTAKYGQQQMNLIKKRLKIEMWLYEQLQELAKGSKSEAELDEIDIDLDQLLDIEDDDARRRWLQKILEPFDDLRQDRLNQFINDVLEQSKLL